MHMRRKHQPMSHLHVREGCGDDQGEKTACSVSQQKHTQTKDIRFHRKFPMNRILRRHVATARKQGKIGKKTIITSKNQVNNSTAFCKLTMSQQLSWFWSHSALLEMLLRSRNQIFLGSAQHLTVYCLP